MEAYGESEHQLDDKCRLNIPRRFHALFEHGGFLTRAFNGYSLALFPHDTWEDLQGCVKAIKTKLTEQDPAHFLRAALATDDLSRFLSCGMPVTLDGQGRVTIPPSLRQRANLKKRCDADRSG